jgi:hypothetical protein
MPFENEFVAYEPLRRILENEKVIELQNRMKWRDPDDPSNIADSFLESRPLSLENSIPDMILTIDGSYQNVPVKNGYPGAEIGYITVASVLMLMRDVKRLAKYEFIDPKKI